MESIASGGGERSNTGGIHEEIGQPPTAILQFRLSRGLDSMASSSSTILQSYDVNPSKEGEIKINAQYPRRLSRCQKKRDFTAEPYNKGDVEDIPTYMPTTWA